MSIKHRFASAKADGGDATLVRPSNWNDNHDFLAGAIILVDAVNGVDGTGVRGNLAFPFQTLQGAIAAAGITSGDVIWLLPGAYNLAAGATIPAGVTVRGQDAAAVTIQMLGVGANTTLITMGVGSRLEDVTVKVTTTGNFNLTGILFSSTSSAAASLAQVYVIVSNVGAGAVAASLTGILVQSTGTPDRGVPNLFATYITVTADAAATGALRGILQNTSVGNFNAELFTVSVSGGTGTNRIGAEINIATGRLTLISGTITAPSQDVQQTAGTLETGQMVFVENTLSGTITLIDWAGILRETGGPTLLTMGAVADGTVLRRSGAAIIGTLAFFQGGNSFGAAADIGTNDAFDVNIRANGTTRWKVPQGTFDWIEQGAGTIRNVADSALTVGTSAQRLSAVSSVVYSVFGTAGDANPTAQLLTGALTMGAGGGTAVDTRVRRSAVSNFAFDNAAGGGAITLGLVSGSLFYESADGVGAAVSGAATGRIRYNNTSGNFEISTQGGAYSAIETAANSFIQGGNSFGAQANLGTNDAQNLALRTNGTARWIMTQGTFDLVQQGAGTLRNTADNALTVGTATQRLVSVSSILFSVFGASGDANPTAQLLTGSLTMGAGGASAVDVRLRRTAANTFTIDNAGAGAATVVPATDSQNNLGTSTLRWSQVNANTHSVFGAAADANPTAQLLSGSLTMGAGGASAVDARFRRTAASTFTVDNAAGGGAISVSAVTGALYYESADGAAAAVSGAATGRIRYNNTSGKWQGSVQGGAYQDFLTAAAGGTAFLQGGNSFGATATLGTNDANILSLETSGASRWQIPAAAFDLIQQGAGTLRSTADNALTLGTATQRIVSVSSILFSVFGASGDANPTAQLLTGSLTMGAGGASAVDVRLRRTAANTFTIDNAGAGAATVVPATDSQNNLGTATLRWSQVNANTHSVFGAAADANPTAQLLTGSLTMGAGGASAVDVRLRRTAANTFTIDNAGAGAATVVPATDSQNNLGTATLRWSQVNSNTHSVYGAAADANPTAQLLTGSLTMGAGGASAVDVRMRRTAASTFTFDNAGAGAATLVGAADNQNALGTAALRWATISVVTMSLFATAADANAAVQVSTTGVRSGAGGASALDTRFARLSASAWVIDNNAGGGTLTLSAVTGALFYESSDGAAAAVSGAATGRLRYNNTSGKWQVSTQAGAYQDLLAAAAGSTAFIQGGNSFGAAANLGTNDAFDLNLRRGGSTIWTVTATALNPASDSSRSIGTASLRLTNVISNLFEIYGTLGDANPTSRYSTSAIFFGVGGATALDTRFQRTGVGQVTLDANGTATQPTMMVTNHGTITALIATGSTFHSSTTGGVANNLTLDTYDTGNLPTFIMRRARGTSAAPSAVLVNDEIGSLSYRAYGATAFATGSRGRNVGVAAETWTDTAQGTHLNFQTTPIGTIATVAVLRIDASGDLVALGNFNWRPGTDNQGNLGTATFRWATAVANQYSVFAAAADANPTVQILTGSITMGAGGASAVDVRMRRTAANTFTFDNGGAGAATLVPAADSQNLLGTATLRWSDIVANTFRVFAASGDANASAQLSTGAVLLGVGGATALDARMRRTAAGTITFDQNNATGADLVPPTTNTGHIGTDSLKWNRVRATTVVTGDLELKDESKNVHYVVVEEQDGIYVFDKIKNKKFKMMLQEMPN